MISMMISEISSNTKLMKIFLVGEEEVEGSKLGINEFRKNLGSLFDSLQYNKKVEQMDETAQKYQERYGKDINDLDENSLSVGNREQRRRQNKTKSK